MNRRTSNGALDDLLEIASVLPWWAGVALAVVSYLILHQVAAMEVTVATQAGQVGSFLGSQITRILASAGQIILPIVFLTGAGASAVKRYRRGELFARVGRGKSSSILGDMTWREFEELVGEAFRLKGFDVSETGGGGPDGGVDLVLSRGGEKYFVQCKQWRAFQVGLDVVRQLYGVMVARGAAGGFVATSGEFTHDAKKFVQGLNIELIDGAQLFKMIQQVRGAVDRAKIPLVSETWSSIVPNCPKCGREMVKRTARLGANAGRTFWGCSVFPNCRGTRDI